MIPDTPEQINDNISLFQHPETLAFGTDAYLLSAYIRHQPREKACELGAGSGVISLLLSARNRFSHITAIEVQPPIADIARHNVEKNGFSGKIDIVNADIRDLPKAMNESFGAVFTNPPYLPVSAGKQNERFPDAAARHELHGGIDDFASAASSLLKYGGLFYAVYRPDRLSELFAACMAHSLMPKRMTLVYPTEKHTPSLVLIEAKKGASSGLFVTKPLIIYRQGMEQKNENYTDDMNHIYENGAFHEQYQKP